MFQGYTAAEYRVNKGGQPEYTYRLSTSQASHIEALRFAQAVGGIDGFRKRWAMIPEASRAALLTNGVVNQWGVTKAGRSMYDAWYSGR